MRDLIETFYAAQFAASNTRYKAEQDATEVYNRAKAAAWEAEELAVTKAAEELHQAIGKRHAAFLGETPEADKIIEALTADIDAKVSEIVATANDDAGAPREAAE